MKVRIKTGIHRWGYDGKKYLPGDIVDIPDSVFVSHIHEAIVEPVVVAGGTVEQGTIIEAPKRKRTVKPVVAETVEQAADNTADS